MDRKYDYSTLLDFYGEMLTERQRLFMEFYYNDDLSLSEIAEEMGISRQGVRAALKKSEEILCEMESKLRLAERFYITKQRFESLQEYVNEIKDQSIKQGDKRLERIADDILLMTVQIEKDIG